MIDADEARKHALGSSSAIMPPVKYAVARQSQRNAAVEGRVVTVRS